MFPFSRSRSARPAARRSSPVGLEPLEHRQLLSATPVGGHHDGGGGRPAQDTVAFSLLPATIQTGLTTLDTTDTLTDATPVALGNQDGVETYTATVRSTGTVSRLTVDAAGQPVTAPTQSTATVADLPAAAAAEVTAIAAATGLTAPTDATTVHVTTTAAGVVTYSVALATDDTTATDARHGRPSAVMVDAAGNPVGNQRLPLSVFATAVQDALTAAAPTGATALTDTSTVDVRTTGGLTTYSVRYTVDGTDTTVTVDTTGAAVAAAATSTALFSAIPAAAQAEIQAIATAKGAGTVAADQSVDVNTPAGGGVTLYAVKLTTDLTDSTDGGDRPAPGVTIVVDASGNPTTLLLGQPRPGGDDHGNAPPADAASGTDDGATTTATPTATRGTGRPLGHATAGGVDSAATPTLGPILSLLTPTSPSAAVTADVSQLQTDAAALRTATRALSKTDAATLRADQRAIAAAVKALSATLSPAQQTLRSDTAKYAATLRADQRDVRRAGSDSTALTTAQDQLAADQAAAYEALSADLASLRALIDADAAVTAARSKLTTDVPSVATAQAAVVADSDKLQADIGDQLTA